MSIGLKRQCVLPVDIAVSTSPARDVDGGSYSGKCGHYVVCSAVAVQPVEFDVAVGHRIGRQFSAMGMVAYDKRALLHGHHLHGREVVA